MGIETAIIGSAILGSAASIYSGNKAAKAATKAADQSNDLQYQMFQESNALNEPWRQAGMSALDARQALLGIGGGGGSGGGAPYGQAQSGGADWNAYLQANPDVAQNFNQSSPHLQRLGIDTPQKWAEYHYNTAGRNEGRQLPTVAGAAPPPGTGTPGASATDNAYNAFLDSGYARSMLETTNNDFQQMVGAFGAAGKSMSGSAIGALNDRNRRNTNNAFTQYDNALAGISNTGSALAANQGAQGLQVAGQIGANNMNAANARGSSYMNTANAINSGLQNATNAFAYGAGNGWFGGGTPSAGGTVTGPNTYVGGTYTNGWG